jgi:hypothetical protein
MSLRDDQTVTLGARRGASAFPRVRRLDVTGTEVHFESDRVVCRGGAACRTAPLHRVTRGATGRFETRPGVLGLAASGSGAGETMIVGPHVSRHCASCATDVSTSRSRTNFTHSMTEELRSEGLARQRRPLGEASSSTAQRAG